MSGQYQSVARVRVTTGWGKLATTHGGSDMGKGTSVRDDAHETIRLVLPRSAVRDIVDLLTDGRS